MNDWQAAKRGTNLPAGLSKALAAPISPAPAGEGALLRRIAQLESELEAMRRTLAGVDGALPVREALLGEAEKIAHLGSWFLDPTTHEVKWSDELFRILGFDPAVDTASAEKFFQALHPDDLARSLKDMEALQTTGRMVPSDLRVIWKDGSVREIHCDGTVVRDADGQMYRVVGTVLDVTDAGRQRRELERMFGFLQEAQSVAKIGSWVWDSASDTLDWSLELVGIFGLPRDALLTMSGLMEMVHPEDKPKLIQYRQGLMADARGGAAELRVIRPDGSLRHVILQAKRLDEGAGKRYLGTVWDITERKQLEEQLRQSQKMEVVGRVAGGVAHDFNNLLTVISGNADLLIEEGKVRGGMGDERARRIRDAAEVGAALTRQLLAFSRQAVIKPEPMDLNDAVRAFTRISDRLIGEDVVIKLELASTAMVILADRGQVQQILLNLAVNARDAMSRGQITFSTREAPGNPLNVGSEPARWVELKVLDTGIGMDAATRQRALEPFFTTKEPGKGTGLGLSTISDIVQQMKGVLAIASEPNQGTTVTIRFPHCNLPAAKTVVTVAPGARLGPTESILLVEDNPELRELIAIFLTSAGHKVQSVGRPSEAEFLWRTQSETIDMLIADMVMPEKSGLELARILTAAKPSLRTLFISGYTPNRTGFGEGAFLQKPFTRIELLNAVRVLADKKAP